MPVIPSSLNPQANINAGSSVTLQQIVNSARAYPELTPVLGTSGYTQEPALTIANDVMARFLSTNMDWKFNRNIITPFLTVALQQDYVTNVTDLAWLEQAWRQDINNTTNPKPIFMLETVRDLGQTSYQANPFNVSWIPNRLAVFGTWRANTAYPGGLGVAQTPASPIQQIIDANGNFLVVTTYGTSGNVAPVAAPNAGAGTTVADNTVVWTVADPNGVAIRLAPLPATSGIVWSITPVYQRKGPTFTSLQQSIAPIPDEFAYLFRAGFMAACYEHAGTKNAPMSYAKWEEMLINTLRSADREREDANFYPSEGIMGGGPYKYGLPIGPAWPFDYWGN